MSGEAWLSGAWLGAQLPRTQPAKTSISLGIANLITMHRLNTYLNMELDLQSLFRLLCTDVTIG
jgi:hypothetical protein